MDEEMELVGVRSSTEKACESLGHDVVIKLVEARVFEENWNLHGQVLRLKKLVFQNFWIGFLAGIAATIAVAGMLMLA